MDRACEQESEEQDIPPISSPVQVRVVSPCGKQPPGTEQPLETPRQCQPRGMTRLLEDAICQRCKAGTSLGPGLASQSTLQRDLLKANRDCRPPCKPGVTKTQ
ncbi:Hypothetical predicted protein, partial [Marmota monax]